MSGFSTVNISEVEKTGERVWKVCFSVPLSSPYYSGHFDSFHLLPAVAEIDIAVRQASLLAERRLTVARIRRTKFTRPIEPDRRMVLTLDLSKENLLSFSYHDAAGNSCSFGNLEVRS